MATFRKYYWGLLLLTISTTITAQKVTKNDLLGRWVNVQSEKNIWQFKNGDTLIITGGKEGPLVLKYAVDPNAEHHSRLTVESSLENALVKTSYYIKQTNKNVIVLGRYDTWLHNLPSSDSATKKSDTGWRELKQARIYEMTFQRKND